MKERPILFSSPMVRAILEGRKTQTRRIVKLRDPSETYSVHDDDGWPTTADECGMWHRDRCPYGEPGDRLWVRETWEQVEHLGGRGEPLRNSCRYRADQDEALGKWRSSIHMPRWASRITLEITDVRVERLQEISQSDAIAEGAPPSHRSIDKVSQEYGFPDFSRSWYAQLWESINGKGSWEKNPRVWVIGFKRVEGMR